MSKDRIFIIKDLRWYCPKCGHNKVRGKSAQVCEDGCEMWFECEKCGYDPAGICDRVVTIMGWQDNMIDYALEVYRDCHPACKKILSERK